MIEDFALNSFFILYFLMGHYGSFGCWEKVQEYHKWSSLSNPPVSEKQKKKERKILITGRNKSEIHAI